MSLGLDKLTPKKIQSTIVVTKELLGEAPAAQDFLSKQLKIAVASAVDAALVDDLLEGVTPIAATANMDADLNALFAAINTNNGRLAWLAAPDVANRLALSNALGSTSPSGVSEFMGLALFVSSGMMAGSLALLNTDLIAGSLEGFGLETATDATLAMDDAPVLPTSVPPAASNTLISLWQSNSIALGLTMLGDLAAAEDAVALVEGVSWTGV